ncbi:hypothetical protein [Nannocystis bainbridge]|uniref:Uncharacterized protein n=1 Tax=Nannocystis bainbridge TaxID=2995303 RepID=A0ABT5DWK2_9BACT|nr:hypothetical protein [Nannocystis bainbridge]MDC0718013.1 hypothetical protein [Nannocystis bainbridge]
MWGVPAALLLLLGCGEPATSAATGPAPVADPAAEVALLAVVEGTVTVRDAGGAETPGRPELPLRRGDTVITTPGSLAVVVLASGYVIKLEEDQATPVRALAHLDDPPPAESVAELFARALGPEALARVGGADRLERIAGWNARRASGETPAPVTRTEAPPAPTKSIAEPAPEAEDRPTAPLTDEPETTRGHNDDLDGAKPKTEAKAPADKNRPTAPPTDQDDALAGPADPAPPPQSPAGPGKKSSTKSPESRPAEPSQEPPGGAPGLGSAEAESSSAAVDLADTWIFETAPDTRVTRTSLPEALKARRQALAQCVAEALPGVAGPELRLKVVGGVVKEVALGGGKPAPACARELLNQRVGGVADGWAIVHVRR